VRMSHSSTKTMLIVFFDIRGIVDREFVPQGQTANTAFANRKRLWTRLHKNTSRSHSSMGRNAVTGALLRNVTISKGMVFKLR
jgi:hypothetical protein